MLIYVFSLFLSIKYIWQGYFFKKIKTGISELLVLLIKDMKTPISISSVAWIMRICFMAKENLLSIKLISIKNF